MTKKRDDSEYEDPSFGIFSNQTLLLAPDLTASTDGMQFVSAVTLEHRFRQDISALRHEVANLVALLTDSGDRDRNPVREPPRGADEAQHVSGSRPPTPHQDESRDRIGPSGSGRGDAPIAAEWVSQKTSMAVFGIDPRRYLDLLRRTDCPLEVIRRGKLRLVEREAFAAWLHELDRQDTGDRGSELPTSDGADAVLRELGLVPSRKTPRR